LGYDPFATFDYNFAGKDSTVTIGTHNTAEGSDLLKANSSSTSTNWALQASAASIGNITGDGFTISDAILTSDYPYLAIPTDLWTQFKAQLDNVGFVCFASPYQQFSHCDIDKICNYAAYELSNLAITFKTQGEDVTVQIPPSVYLNETNSNTSCECLISESLDYAEAFILGDPFFRNHIVTLGYQWQDIQLFSKEVNTGIVPT
jgi:hypothetical protein